MENYAGLDRTPLVYMYTPYSDLSVRIHKVNKVLGESTKSEGAVRLRIHNLICGLLFSFVCSVSNDFMCIADPLMRRLGCAGRIQDDFRGGCDLIKLPYLLYVFGQRLQQTV